MADQTNNQTSSQKVTGLAAVEMAKHPKGGKYNTIDDMSMIEIIVKKSRFIAVAFHVETIEEVRQKLGTLRKSNAGAKHIPYAYMLGPDFSVGRNNDDEEPAGSAGDPIYAAIKAAGMTNILVAVVRYFGGIELGKSKLTSTYNAAATECINNAKKYRMRFCGFYTLKVSYSEFAKLGKLVDMKNLPVIEKNFDDAMPMLKVAIPADKSNEATEDVKSRIQGGVAVSRVGEGYYRFPW